MPRTLITGSAGVLGSEVLTQLALSSEPLRVLTRNAIPNEHAELVQSDLVRGNGLDTALCGVHTIVHCASAGAANPADDVTAMGNLLRASRRAGIQHFLYISIVGIENLKWFPYYAAKLACERLLIESGLPWSIQRATQFHTLVAHFLTLMIRGPFMITPAGAKLQPVEAEAVARHPVRIAQSAPTGRLPDLAGPEVHSIESLANVWQRAVGKHEFIVPLPLPILSFRLLRSNKLYSSDCKPIGITWEEWLQKHATEANPYAART